MNVLALNCGSSSVRFQVVGFEEGGAAGSRGRRVAGGLVERIGAAARLIARAGTGPSIDEPAGAADHASAVRRAIDWLTACGASIDAVGHRVVHGGSKYFRTTLLDAAVESAIVELEDLAPMHNAPCLAGIRAARSAFARDIPMAAVFDTGFHADLPPRAGRYGIPKELAVRHGIRRFGFHGIAYRYVLQRYTGLTSTPRGKATLVAFHLGGGASSAAVKDGRCVDTTMGMTPLEGLLMGTRSGDIDPAIVWILAQRENLSFREVEAILTQRSGLLGVSGRSADMRDLLEAEAHDLDARLAIELFCYRARKTLGAYLAALGGADAVVFSGGIGEHAPQVRARICDGMEWAGLSLDAWKNHGIVGREGEIGAQGSRIRALVIPVDEEIVIAEDTRACLTAPARDAAGEDANRA